MGECFISKYFGLYLIVEETRSVDGMRLDNIEKILIEDEIQTFKFSYKSVLVFSVTAFSMVLWTTIILKYLDHNL